MKGGRVPVHIQRWSPADFHQDEHVKLLKARKDWRTLTFYRHFIDQSYIAGGDLTSDPEALAAVVEMPLEDVKAALEFCMGRLIRRRGARLVQARVAREIAGELAFRDEQRRRGLRGGRPKKGNPPVSVRNPPVSQTSEIEKPAVRRAPTPAPTPTNGTNQPAREVNRRNPHIGPGERPKWETECMALVREAATRENRDPAEVFAEAADYKGAFGIKTNPANLTEDRLVATVLALRKRAAKHKPPAADPPPERSPYLEWVDKHGGADAVARQVVASGKPEREALAAMGAPIGTLAHLNVAIHAVRKEAVSA